MLGSYLVGSRVLVASAILVALASCGKSGPAASSGAGGGSAGATSLHLSVNTGPGGPPKADAGGFCGNDILPLTLNPPTVYFVLDISGSMATAVGSSTRFDLVMNAVLSQVSRLSALIKVGAAAFPLNVTDATPCSVGGEIVAPTLNGIGAFNRAIQKLSPNGGTPTSATLNALAPNMKANEGKTIVVLATDGGPNCNALANCTIDQCTTNIELCPGGAALQCCASSSNCCLPTLADPQAASDCLDETATVAAVKNIASMGMPVYVVGIPGSEIYSNVLQQMAIAGGAPQFASPYYYQVTNLSKLGDVLQKIAAGIIPCSYTLQTAPPDPTMTNVYFDSDVVTSDPANGWSWTSSVQVTLNGDSCAKLKSGAVSQVQIVSGCPTDVLR